MSGNSRSLSLTVLFDYLFHKEQGCLKLLFWQDRSEQLCCVCIVEVQKFISQKPREESEGMWCILWVWSKLFSLTGKPHGGSTQPTSGGPDILNIRTLASSLCKLAWLLTHILVFTLVWHWETTCTVNKRLIRWGAVRRQVGAYL